MKQSTFCSCFGLLLARCDIAFFTAESSRNPMPEDFDKLDIFLRKRI